MPKLKKRPSQQLKPVFHIFCEGEKTEPNYLNGYIGRMFPGTKLIKVEETKKNTPLQLVEEAVDMQLRTPDGDTFWVVYDRESEAKYPDSLHVQARQKAGNKVSIALSNVCFEVWLLLHFEASVAPYPDCDSLLKKSKLRKHIPDYDKANKRKYSDKEIVHARQCAERMNQATINGADPSWTAPSQWNPYTNVHELLDAIDDFGAKHAG